MLEIAPYSRKWPARFRAESELIRNALGSSALRVEHVGSTAVRGLAAKPVIDIQVSVESLEPFAPLREALEALGYAHVPLGDFDLVYPYFTKPAACPSTHHVHLCVYGSQQEVNHLLFRDHLRRSPATRAAYVQLKRELAARHHGLTIESRESYSLAKTNFVQQVLREANISCASTPR